MTALATALVAAGVPAAIAAGSLVSEHSPAPATSHQDATSPRADHYIAPELTDATDTGYRTLVYRNTLAACEAASDGMLGAIAYMALWSHTLPAPAECASEPKGKVAQAFWKRSDVGEVVTAFAKGLRVEKGTARKYLRVAVGYALHKDYDAMVPAVKLDDAHSFMCGWLDNGGNGNIRDMAERVGVVWSSAKGKREETPYGEDPTAREESEADAKAARDAADRKVKAAQSLADDDKARVITLGALVAYFKGAVIPEGQEQAYRDLAALILSRVDVSEADRTTSHQDATSQVPQEAGELVAA